MSVPVDTGQEDVITGRCSRYRCATAHNVLCHLYDLRRWIDGEERRLRTRPIFIRRMRNLYHHDTDLLLNALVMLAALGTLDDDCERFGDR